MKKNLDQGRKAIYVSLDDLYFSEKHLVYFAQDFARNGGEYLFLDEVHKYSNWSQEIKNIYDTVIDLEVVNTCLKLEEKAKPKNRLPESKTHISLQMT